MLIFPSNCLPSDSNACLMWIFSPASWLTDTSVGQEEDRVTALWTDDDTACTPVAEVWLYVSVVWKNFSYVYVCFWSYNLFLNDHFRMAAVVLELHSSLCIISLYPLEQKKKELNVKFNSIEFISYNCLEMFLSFLYCPYLETQWTAGTNVI